MICITDPVEVFRILEIHGEADFNPKENHTACFQCDQHFAVLIFCFDGIAKGPRLYLFDPPLHHSEVESEITADLSTVTGDALFENACSITLENLRKHIEMLSPSNFFFDAH